MYSCGICNKTLKQEGRGHGNLKQHYIHLHTNAEKIICSACDKSFLYKNSFQRHLRQIHKVDELRTK